LKFRRRQFAMNEPKKRVLLGYESTTGNAVYIPTDMNIAATGQTRRTGKTTALEAIITRGKFTCLTFRTKRGESGFLRGIQIYPFYRPRADWVYVKSLAEAALDKELPGLYDRWFMEATGETGKLPKPKDLKEVRRNIDTLLEGNREVKAARGFAESMLFSIRGYLDLVLPDLFREGMQWSSKLELQEGVINVMDLEGLSEGVQSLIIASCLEEVFDKLENIVVVVPEAPDFFPAGKGSPSKVVGRRIAKKGGAINNFLYLDSQMIVDVDPIVRSQARLWLLGPQGSYEHEIERTLKLLPKNLGKIKPTASDVQTLPLGHFYLVIAEEKIVKKVYAAPWWLPEDVAKEVAKGELSPKSDKVRAYRLKATEEGEEELEMVWKEKAEKLEKERIELSKAVGTLEEKNELLEKEITKMKQSADFRKEAKEDTKEIRAFEKLGNPKEATSPLIPLKADIAVNADDLTFQVIARDKPMEFDTSNVRGQIMRVMIEVIGKGREASQQQIIREASEFGYAIDSGNCSRRTSELVGMGALVKTDSGVRLPTKAEFLLKTRDDEVRKQEEPIEA
jgi:hypothetical protein